MDLQGALVGLVGQVVNLVNQVIVALRGSPGGFGLVVIPLGILWAIALLVSRRR